jgi:hypothetical protein
MAAKLTDFVAKATQKPYELELPDGTVISIAHPALTKWKAACDADDAEGFMTVLGVSAEDAAKVAGLAKDAPMGTVPAIVADIRDHFNSGN